MNKVISDFNIVRYSHRDHRCRYDARFILDNGEVITRRLTGIYGTADKIENESKYVRHMVDAGEVSKGSAAR